MLAIDENTITDAALEQMSATSDRRLKQIMAALSAPPACFRAGG